MDITKTERTINSLTFLFVANLLLYFHLFIIYYTASGFIKTVVGEKWIGLIYIIGSILSLVIFINSSKILSKLGNYKLILILAATELLSLLGLAYFSINWVTLSLFVLQLSVYASIPFCLDIFLENYSKDKETGGVRGMYLTMMNTASVISPFIAGLILAKPEYWKVYLISAIFLIPFIYIIATSFKSFKDPEYIHVPLKDTLKSMWADKNIFDIFIDNFLLHIFYAWMVIYMPIYLNSYIGFSWPEIGLMFSIMLLPFILFQVPLGKLADEKLGEKEILITGFIIMSASTMLISFINERSFILWTAVLFVTRIGASFVELSSESYFFKKVSVHDANKIGVFRMTRSAQLIAPIVVTGLLFIMPYQYIFFVLGIITLYGVRYALVIEDTK